ncbi:hypothetical protein BV22DRAFT_1023213 [Leucogyrophana mollusca]|uniref:Uncharacterized protein n=1 Tax=Leucogyrophana mollusca TaxID=85980 RepID=A0ACB8B1B2_9AGAM|nr:hypothetical protein BV22DRAFT_1023213 [Leucogyrophana mollusca]
MLKSSSVRSFSPDKHHIPLLSYGGSRNHPPRDPRSRIWRSAVVAGQLLILALAWGFWGVVVYRKRLPLPDGTANFLHSSPGESTLIITLISTVLSIFGTFLFTTSIRHALARRMTEPISLLALSAGIELSKGSFLLTSRHIRWTVTTLFCTAMLRTLTAGWTTLLTPTSIILQVDMSGTELDMQSDAFSHLMDQLYSANDSGSASGSYTGPAMELSGTSAAGRKFGLPSILNFNGASYNISTGGVLPNNGEYNGTAVSSNKTGYDYSGGHIPTRVSLEGLDVNYQGLSRNYSMIQQGYTANVTCQQWNLDYRQPPTGPPMWESSSYGSILVGNWNPFDESGANYTLRKWDWETLCPTGIWAGKLHVYDVTLMTIADENDVVLSNTGLIPARLCASQTLDGNATAQQFILVLQGMYAYDFIPQTICQVVPIYTTVRVDYSGGIISVSEIINQTKPDASGVNAFPSAYAADTINARFYTAQNLWGNTIGDSLSSIFSTQEVQNGDANAILNAILEDYLVGVIEFMGTYLRSGFSADGNFPNNELPSNMSIPFSGTMQVETIGWAYDSYTYLLALVPTTVVALLTIAAALFRPSQGSGFTGEGDGDSDVIGGTVPFNPADSLHVIMASSAGSLSQALAGFRTTAVSDNENVRVRLGFTADGRRALVVDDTSAFLENREGSKSSMIS